MTVMVDSMIKIVSSNGSMIILCTSTYNRMEDSYEISNSSR